MNAPVQSQQIELARRIGKLLRENFGKGPDSLFVSIHGSIITMYLRNFLSPTEKVLLEQRQEKVFFQTRDAIMTALIPKMKAYISVITGLDIKEFYYDWGLTNGSGIFVALSTDVEDPQLKSLDRDYEGKQQIHEEILSISEKVEKQPSAIYSCPINSRTLLIFREEILVPIEKELSRLGFGEVLRFTKLNLEKGYLHNNPRFEAILGTEVTDIFVTWDFALDKSVIVIIREPANETPSIE
jgi:uncharacterized protein YbcI